MNRPITAYGPSFATPDVFVHSAFAFAAGAHAAVGQRRKYTDEPYIVHPARVASLVSQVRPCHDEMIAAAYLHDVVEDTKATIETITEFFGEWVARLVEEVTDVSVPSDGNRAARKAIDREHLANASADAQTIKLADLIDNTRDIVKHDPEFAKTYLREKEALLAVLTKGDRILYDLATRTLEEAKIALS